MELIRKTTGWDGEIVTPEPAELPEELQPAHNTAFNLYADTTRIRKLEGFSEPVPLAESISETINLQRLNTPDPLPEELFDYSAEDKLLNKLGK